VVPAKGPVRLLRIDPLIKEAAVAAHDGGAKCVDWVQNLGARLSKMVKADKPSHPHCQGIVGKSGIKRPDWDMPDRARGGGVRRSHHAAPSAFAVAL
jgi:hypothetical protein